VPRNLKKRSQRNPLKKALRKNQLKNLKKRSPRNPLKKAQRKNNQLKNLKKKLLLKRLLKKP